MSPPLLLRQQCDGVLVLGDIWDGRHLEGAVMGLQESLQWSQSRFELLRPTLDPNVPRASSRA